MNSTNSFVNETPRASRRAASVALLLLTLTFSACGGGGGGGGDGNSAGAGATTGPSAVSEVPLTLNTANADSAASLTMGYGTVAIGLAQLAIDWSAEAEAAASLSATTACAGGGSRVVTLVDRDANRRASAGDQLIVNLNRCYLAPQEDIFDGALTLDYTTPTAPDSLAGTMSFGTQFGPVDTSVTVRLGGALRFESTSERLAKTLRAFSAPQPFSISGSTPATATTAAAKFSEMVTLLDARREVRRDTARAVFNLRYHLASELLGGSLDVSTSTPWSAWFGAFPDAGELRLVGASAGNTVQLQAPSANSVFTSQVLLGGVAASALNVADISSSYLWSATGWIAPDPSAVTPVPLKAAPMIGFVALAMPAGTQLPQSGALSWQYSRPLAPATVRNAVLRKTGGRPGVNWSGPVDLAAEVRIEGALLSVTPAGQLEPGSSYQIIFDNSFNSLLAASGEATSNPSISFSVAQTVTASASVGAPGLLLGSSASLSLDASASTVAPGAGTPSAQWRQLSGPALTIVGADTLRPVISAAAPSNGQAVLEVLVRNAAGDIDKQTLTVPVLADLSTQALVFSVREGSKPAAIYTNVDAAASFSYVRYFAANNALDAILNLTGLGTVRLLTQLPSWQAGNTLPYGNGGSPGAIVVWSSPSATCFGNAVGRLALLDYALDASGTVSRLAVDLDQTCDADSKTTAASIRYNSSIPLRP